ncbi:MAG: YwaF family protein [Bacilli bacterium]|nr:YwaF family protein [Bacilli bacterium]
MFKGYGFFDYKYDIPNYNEYDYNHFGRWLYLIIGVVLITALLIIFRKASRKTVLTYLRIMSLCMIGMYLTKTIWESVHDIKRFGEFNLYLLPFDTCSIIMWAGLAAGFGKGRLKTLGECWLISGGIVGGFSAMLFLSALKYYPFFTFGAFYSMIWHIVMVFTGLWLVVTVYVEPNFKSLMYGFVAHMMISVPIIILDYALKLDFMMYYGAGGIPLIESLADILIAHKLRFFVTIIVSIVYFGVFAFIIYLMHFIKRLIMHFKAKKA